MAVGILIFFVRFELPQSRAVLIINFENGLSRKFEGPVMPGTSVIQAIYAASLNGRRFDIKYHIDADGNVNLASINKFINVGVHNWHFYLNGRPIETKDLDRIKLKAGDLIEAKYE